MKSVACRFCSLTLSSPQVRELANTSLHCAEMMGMIIHRAMALFTDNSSKRSFDEMNESVTENVEMVNLATILHKVESVIRSYPKSVKPEIQILDGCPQHVLLPKGGETALYQSTLNFLTNACKATKEGKITLSISAEVKFLQVECRDSGLGVKQER